MRKRTRTDQRHDLMVAEQSGLSLLPQARDKAASLRWEEEINHLVNQLLSSKPDLAPALRAVLTDRRAARMFLREMRFCLGLTRRG